MRAERLVRITRFAIPLALATFAAVALLQFPDLPARVPIHFNHSGAVDRWASPKQFIGLITMTTGLLAAALLAARHYARTERVGADHVYSRHPDIRHRVLVVLDVIGAGGVLLLAWIAHVCARVAHLPDPAFPRAGLLLPLGTLVAAAFAAALWTRRV